MTAPGNVLTGEGIGGATAMAEMPLWKTILNFLPFLSGPSAAPAQQRNVSAPGHGTAPEVFRRDVQIRFAHCDPAGIVFYPQYFVILNGLMEDWFTEGLGVDFADMVTRRKIGIPTARIDCTFSSPSYLGEQLSLGVSVTRIGDKSISIEVTGSANGELRLKATQTIVMMCLATKKSIPIPADIRSGLLRDCRGGQIADAAHTG